jgi:hypothetical protein
MKERVLPSIRRRNGGQTLVIALIVLGVLLLLGFVFLGLIDSSLHSQGLSQSSSQATDLAEAGVRDAHSRMLTSELGADYRGTPSYFVSTVPTVSGDPDLLYLRPGTQLGLRSPTDRVLDQGGPDGLGPFVRYTYAGGRALVRIRYAPSDANLFVNSPVGALRNPGAARDYLIIESVGRPGLVLLNDPTTLNATGGIQYTGYGGNWQTFHNAYLQMEQSNGQIATSRRLIAMQAIGITEQAMFITNIDHVNRPAEIGIPSALSAFYTATENGNLVSVTVGSNPDFPNPQTADQATYGGQGLSIQIGSQMSFPNAQGQQIAGMSAGGGIRSNADLKIYGNVALYLNQSLGEQVDVAGSIIPSDANAQLVVDRSSQNASGQWVDTGQIADHAAAFDTGSTTFDTLQGAIRDALGTPDANGYSRSIGREEPPSISNVDAATGENRYVQATRDSGVELSGVNTGNYGYGRGVYVDNSSDRQNPTDEQGRQEVGSQESLVYDWLNPNNGQSGSGWQGPYYVPPGAYVQLLRDGFVIQRNNQGVEAQRYWRNPNGVSTGTSVIRYRIGADPQGVQRIVSTFGNPTLDMAANLRPTDFAGGFPFNGVLYFEGNVRIRGIIPTDVQLMLVSNATVYVEGSILKGDLETEWSASQDGAGTNGTVINHAPKATLMLAAKDYVVINTPNFFGPTPGQVLQVANDVPNGQQYKPLDLASDGSLEFIHEMVMDTQPTAANPNINLSNPTSYVPFATTYTDPVNGGLAIVPSLTLVHTMDNGPAAVSFIQLLINYQGTTNATGAAVGALPWAYEFPITSSDYQGGVMTNSAAGFDGDNALNIPTWGLGSETWQRYPKFEADEFSLNAVGPGAMNPDLLTVNPAGTNSVQNFYTLYTREANDFIIQPTSFTGTPTNDYLLGRAFITPDDVKIEASMFAEEGSFFVIPGQWMNPNPDDRHDLFPSLGNNLAEQLNARLQNFGSNPLFPFYAEPPDIRITISGAISQNMPVPIAEQAEWIRKWGWIPNHRGSDSGDFIPGQHVPTGYLASRDAYVPNLIINYDPVLATATNSGYVPSGPTQASVIRQDQFNRVLPPIPRLPVSPALAYFGEVN